MKQPFFSSKSFPRISAGPQKPQKLTSLKIKSEKFGPKISIPGKNMDIQEIDLIYT